MYDMQSLLMENTVTGDHFKVKGAECDGIKSKHHSLCKFHEEMISKKNQIILENLCNTLTLQCMVDELGARQIESKTRQAELEDALKHEKKRNSDLRQRADQILSTLEKERKTCEIYKLRLTMAQQKGENSCSTLGSKLQAELRFQLRHSILNEDQLIQQKNVLDESTKTLLNLQKEFTDLSLRFRNNDLNYRELLKSHTALQIRYEKLSHT